MTHKENMKLKLAKRLVLAVAIAVAPLYAVTCCIPTEHGIFGVVGVQIDSASPLTFTGVTTWATKLIGQDAIWQPLIGPIQGSAFTTIPAATGFSGASCQSEYRRGNINAEKGSLTLDIYLQRCQTPGSSAVQGSGSWTIVADSFSSIIGGTGSITIEHRLDGSVVWFIDGITYGAVDPSKAALPLQTPKGTPLVPFGPTPIRAVDAMLKLANLKADDVVYDLGSGDGRIVNMAAQQFGAHGVGVDINPKMVQVAKENARKAGVEELVEFRHGDMFEADVSRATVVTLFLLPSANQQLRSKLLRELKPGTRIVSYQYGIGDWKPDKAEMINQSPVYLWTVPVPKPTAETGDGGRLQ